MEAFDLFRQRLLERENRIWDEQHGLDTRGWVVPDEDSTASGVADGFPYAGTHVRLGRAMFRALKDCAPGATFVDLGSGKGRVLFLAVAQPFAEIVGVEYDEHLHAIAERNVSRHKGDDPRPVRVELADVRRFRFPATSLMIYLNNPFPEPVLAPVLANLAESYEAQPRAITIVYQQLRNEDAEHDTRNIEMLDELDFATRRSARLRWPVDRWLLRPYALHAFASSERGHVEPPRRVSV